MPEYRAYAVGDSGYEPLVCVNDEEAITKAKTLAQRHDVALWRGATLVRLIPKRPARAVTYEVHEGRMVPKPAT